MSIKICSLDFHNIYIPDTCQNHTLYFILASFKKKKKQFRILWNRFSDWRLTEKKTQIFSFCKPLKRTFEYRQTRWNECVSCEDSREHVNARRSRSQLIAYTPSITRDGIELLDCVLVTSVPFQRSLLLYKTHARCLLQIVVRCCLFRLFGVQMTVFVYLCAHHIPIDSAKIICSSARYGLCGIHSWIRQYNVLLFNFFSETDFDENQWFFSGNVREFAFDPFGCNCKEKTMFRTKNRVYSILV